MSLGSDRQPPLGPQEDAELKNPMVPTAHSIQVPRPRHCFRLAGAAHSAKAGQSTLFPNTQPLLLARVGCSFSFAKIPPTCPFLFPAGHCVPRTKLPFGLGPLQREHPGACLPDPGLPLTSKLAQDPQAAKATGWGSSEVA